MLEKVNVEGLGISLSSAEEKIEVVASRESVLLMMAVAVLRNEGGT